MLRYLIPPCLWLIILSSLKLSADEVDASLAQLTAQAEQQQLASHPYWRALLHYPKQKPLFTEDRSQITSKDFFLAEQGAINPQAELHATLRALLLPIETDDDNQPACRYIARYYWLREQLNWPETVNGPHCPKFEEFAAHGKVNAISLVFATGFLSNPASFYGHVLLKFNNSGQLLPLDLLDQSLNYGAIVSTNENGLLYIIKGLLGGYDAAFSHDLFYRHNHIYVENELRDLWEYKLNLSQQQVNQIIYHSWELLGAKFQYFFLDKNCAYYMAELLELAINKPLKSEHSLWSLPVNLFNRLATIDKQNPLISDIRYLPSRQNQFNHRYRQLNTEQQQELTRLVTQKLPPTTLSAELTDNDKIAITDTLLDYYEFRQLVDPEEEQEQAKQKKHQLLIYRIGLQSQEAGQQSPFTAKPPTAGPLPLMLRTGLSSHTQLGEGVSLTARSSYYDLLNLEAGRLPNAHLTTLELELFIKQHEIYLRHFDLFRIENLNVSQSGLPKDGGFAWRVRLFADNSTPLCRSCSRFNALWGIGKSLLINRHLIGYAMLDLTVSSHSDAQSSLLATPNLGLLASLNERWRTHLKMSQQHDLEGKWEAKQAWLWENRFGSNRDWDLRLNYLYQQDREEEIQAAVSFYW